MLLSVALSLALYAFITSVTPGPNNLMLASSGLTFGFRRTLPQVAGVSAGCLLLIALSGTGLGALFRAEPRIQSVLKIAGGAYLLYLAWRMWNAGELKRDAGGTPIGFWRAAAFQFVNPKVWVMAITAVTAFAAPGPGDGYLERMLLVCLIFSIVNLPCIASWALFGASVRSLLRAPGATRWFNRGMAVLTAATAVVIAL